MGEPPDGNDHDSDLTMVEVESLEANHNIMNDPRNLPADSVALQQASVVGYEIPYSSKQFLRDNRLDIVGIVEPRSSGSKADLIIASLGFHHSHRIEATGYSGGIWLCWYDSVEVSILLNHFQFIHFRVSSKCDNASFLATLVYASLQAMKRRCLWHHIGNLASSIHSPWILLGDLMRPLMPQIGKGPDFTWSHGMAQARLDRVLCNSYWDEFPDSMPILLSVGDNNKHHHNHPFRYFSGWLKHDDFPRLVTDNWSGNSSLSDTIRAFTHAADSWNKNVFGYIGMKKKIVMARLRGVQKALGQRHSSLLSSLESELLLELERLLDEELMWRQKSRSDWIHLGDRNTKYFHKKSMLRKQRNKIAAIKLNDGTWCHDEDVLKEEAWGMDCWLSKVCRHYPYTLQAELWGIQILIGLQTAW
ncbi:uncharacterized protein LOC120117180 [Hibiscus syriacus]|uniref:uncharacterized protein LOC120117180 n=1 Tax=Hibiscus syriacus TaxID=106335 RepID=UPI0019223C21|nr:uncharacterized protein LOC120117180 [Hibiscus syriacus]